MGPRGDRRDGDKNLYRDNLTAEVIDGLASAAGEVNKQLLAGDMGLAHRRLQPARPTRVETAEPGIAEPVGCPASVLLPQRRQGHIGRGAARDAPRTSRASGADPRRREQSASSCTFSRSSANGQLKPAARARLR